MSKIASFSKQFHFKKKKKVTFSILRKALNIECFFPSLPHFLLSEGQQKRSRPALFARISLSIYFKKKLIMYNATKEIGGRSNPSPMHLPKIILHLCVHCPQIQLQSQKWTRELYHVPFSTTYKYMIRNSQGSRCEVSWFQLIWFRSSQRKVPQIMRFYKVAPEEP